MSKQLSPTAQLLRSSRLFSIPPPLPRPSLEFPASIGFKRSETASLPYPTQQAIAAPSSSQSRGDWGLKRALPLKKTARSNATLRITALDTTERITDYESASDHVKTLEKFEEMRLALSRVEVRDTITKKARAAFVEDYDYTDKQTEPRLDRSGRPRRWKYGGPDVGTMTDGEFDAYVRKEVKERKDAFYSYLRTRLHRQNLIEKRREAVESGLEAQARYLTWLIQIPNKEFTAYKDELTQASDEEFPSWLGGLSAETIYVRQQIYHLMRAEAIEALETNDAQFPYFFSELPEHELASRWKRARGKISNPENERTPEAPPSSSKYIRFVESDFNDQHTPERQLEILKEAGDVEKEYVRGYSGEDFEKYVLDRTRIMRADTTTQSELNRIIREFLDMRPIKNDLGSKIEPRFGGPSEAGDISTHPSAGLSYLRTNSVLENHPILGPQARHTPVEARVLSPKSMDRRPQPKAMLGIAGIAVEEPPAPSGYSEQDPNSEQLKLDTPGGGKVWMEPLGAHIDGKGRIRLEVQKPTNRNIVQIQQGHLSSQISAPAGARRSQSSPLVGRFSTPFDSQRSGNGSYGDLAAGMKQMNQRPSQPHPTIASLNKLLQEDTKTNGRTSSPYPTR